MATLVLTTLGTMLGGPVGGLFGALAGQAADALLFKPKGREGPRLSDLHVQTSRYGDRMPRIFGRMRVAGTVIWSTDLRESASTAGGGKGQPSVTSYSYAASFAVALSARAISGIGRIWADGNLLRGSAGDFKVPLGSFRVHGCTPDQPIDPLIGAAVGIDQAPAFRGVAYVVFEDLQLADFGNRIPSLTFELVADESPIGISALAADLLGRPVAFLGEAEPTIAGYAADGDDVGAALAPLLEVHGLNWRFAGDGVALVAAVSTGRSIEADDALRAIDGKSEPLGARQTMPMDHLPIRLSLRHFDSERDYQAGVQTAMRAGAGVREEEVALPALLSADTARTMADRMLRRQIHGRRTLQRAVIWSALDLQVGDLVTVAGERGDWLVQALEWEAMAVRLTLRSHGTSAAVPPTGDPGAPVLEPDLVQGVTHLVAVERLPLDGSLASSPCLFVAATGADAGWKRAALFRYRAETSSAEPLGRTAPRAVIGAALTALPTSACCTIDERTHVDIELTNDADSLVDADDQALIAGANACILGQEHLQFGAAQPLEGRRYRLSRLIRGRHGTEWACGSHEAGEPFLLLDPSKLVAIPTTMADLGGACVVRAVGLGDAVPAETEISLDGGSILPPAPVHGVALEQPSGDLQFSWIRRSRLGWLWPDGAEVPLGEEREAYQIRVMAGGAAIRTAESLGASWLYLAAALAADLVLVDGAALSIEVRQIGTHGLSRPFIFHLA